MGSGSRPSCFARTSSQCAGMITKKTFATMIVPSIAPTSMYAARGESSSPAAHALRQTNAKTESASAHSRSPSRRQSSS